MFRISFEDGSGHHGYILTNEVFEMMATLADMGMSVTEVL